MEDLFMIGIVHKRDVDNGNILHSETQASFTFSSKDRRLKPGSKVLYFVCVTGILTHVYGMFMLSLVTVTPVFQLLRIVSNW